MLPTLVTTFDSPRHREWGLIPEKVAEPFLALPSNLGIHEALEQALSAFPGAERVCYAQQEFLYEFFSLDLLYEGGLHRWLAAAGSLPLVFRRVDLPEPADLLCVRADAISTADPLASPTHTGEIEMEILRDDPRGRTFVFGDSHVFNLYTRLGLIGKRGLVVEPVLAGGIEQLKLCRHIGSVTMHRLAERGEITAEFFRGHGLRSGDRIVAVCGEIDVRNHVGRVALEQGIPVDQVIADVCRRFCIVLERAVAGLQPIEVVLSCPTPPLDFEQRDPSSDPVEHWGSLEDRIAGTLAMRMCLQTESRARGWGILDLCDTFADDRGALDFERSDRFCHVAHAHKAPALEALMEIMTARPSRQG